MGKRKKSGGSRARRGDGGVGRREEAGGSGVWPESLASSAPPDAAIRTPAEWGQGGDPEGYEEGGRSELNFTLEEAEEYRRQKEKREGG